MSDKAPNGDELFDEILPEDKQTQTNKAPNGDELFDEILPAATTPNGDELFDSIEGQQGPDPKPAGQELGAAPSLDKTEYKRNDVLFGDMITPGDLNTIASKYGVNQEDLSSYVEFLGGNQEKDTIAGTVVSMGVSVIGQLQKSVGMGIPSLLLIESQKDEGFKKALYELRELADKKQGVMATLGQGAAMAVSSMGIAKMIVPTSGALIAGLVEAGSNVTGGAVAGFAGENDREETGAAALDGAKFGAIVSALPIIGKGAYGFVKGLKAGIRGESELADKAFQVIQTEAKRINDASQTAQTLLAKGDFSVIYDTVELAKATDKEVMQVETSFFLESISKEERGEIAQQMKDLNINPEKETEFIFQRKVQQDVTDFATSVAGKEITNEGVAKTILQDFMNREGPKALGEAFEHHLEKKAATNLLKDGLLSLLPSQGNQINRMYDGVKDARYAYQAIDNRLGTSTVPLIDDMSQNLNLFGNEMRKHLPRISELTVLSKEAELTNKEIYQALDSGITVGSLPPKKVAAIEAWKSFFEENKKRANELGLPITTYVNAAGQTSYVPHQRLFGTELLDQLAGQVEKIKAAHGIDVLTTVPKDATEAAKLFDDPLYKDLRESIAYMKGGTIKEGQKGAVGLKEVQDSMRDIMRGQPLERDMLRGTTATSLYKRDMEAVPSLIRNENMVQLATGWTNNTYKHAFMRSNIDSLAKVRDIAITLGDERAATYINKHITDMVSPTGRSTIANDIRQYRTQAYVALSARAAKGSKSAALMQSFLKDDNDIFSLVANQVYPNFLGFNVRATLQNAAQPLTMTVPELGYKYGTEHYGRAIKDIVTGKAPSMDLLRETGRIQESFSQEMQDVLRQNVEVGSPKGTSRKALETYNEAAMFMYAQAELLNRRTISTMATNVADDLLKGRKEARNFIYQMDSGTRRAIAQAEKWGGKEGAEIVTDRINKYLLGKTGLNYDKASLSEWGRSVGPILSSFTKWPSAMIGEAFAEMEERGGKGLLKVFAKYGAPYIAFKMTNNLLTSEGVLNPEQPGVSQVLLGKKGLQGLSPAGNFESILKGQLTPPIIAVPLSLAKGAFQGNLLPAIDNAVNSFLPYGSGIRVMDDIFQVIDGSHFGRSPLKVLEEQRIIEGKGQK